MIFSPHRFLQIRTWFLLSLAFLFVGGLYLFYLDLKIRTKFEARRWNLPSRVYSDIFYLFPGQGISPQRVEEKLKRLAYKRVFASVKSAGEFSRRGSELQIYLHNFSYPSEEFAGFPVRLLFDEGHLKRLESIETGEGIKTLKLEPELIASIFDEKMEDRTVVSLEEIPEELTQAVVAIEDERFYSHYGVDPIAILRAVLVDLLHLKLVQGGSTLTQQLVKNFFLTQKKSFVRKFNELWMALLLERRFTKEEILEAYLNEIYFGQKGPVSVAGVQEAAALYFSKNASQLTLAESALLAGLIRAPGLYSPFRNLANAYDRRNFVLKTMYEKEIISESEFRKAKRESIVLASTPVSKTPLGAPYFVDFLRTKLKENYGDILTSEGLRIFTTLDAEAQEAAERILQNRLEEYEKSRPSLREPLGEGKKLEGCLVAIQPQTGSIRAYVGGRNYSESQFDHLSMARRQPGSAFKPFVYLAALMEGPWTLASIIEDKSFSIESGGEVWEPKNYDEEEHGLVTLREALEQSYNLATAKLAIEVGPDRIVDLAQQAGISTPLEPYPSIALGSFEVIPLDLARAYTIFPNNGIRPELIPFTRLVTRDGTVLEKKDLEMARVVPHDQAYLMNSALQGVIDRGTAQSAHLFGFSTLAAGKTGTTSDYRDSWFVGYSPDLLALTWVGYDDGTPTGLTGASGGLPIWVDFMKRFGRSEQKDFLATDRIILLNIDRQSGKRFRSGCKEKFEEAFILGTEPKERCR